MTSRRTVAEWMIWLTVLALTTAMLLPVRAEIEQSHISLTLVLVVLGGSAGGGRRLGLTLALLGFVIIDYSFQPPYDQLAVNKTLDWVVLLAFLAAAFVATELLTHARAEAERARTRSADIESLSHIGAATLRYATAAEALGAITALVRQTLGAERCAIHAHATGAASSATVTADGVDAPGIEAPLVAAAAGVSGASDLFAARREGGVVNLADDDATIPAGAYTGFAVSLRVERRLVGVLVVTAAGSATPLPLDAGRRRFLGALSYYAALGVERMHLGTQAEEARVLREANRAKDEVLAAVSHDLRTPLATIKVLAQRSRTTDRRTAELIEEETDRLTRMVSDLLDLSRLRMGGFTLDRELNTAEDLVGTAIQRAQGLLNGRTIRADLDMTQPVLAGRFDLVHSLRIVGNLVDNSLRFTPAGGIVDVSTGRDGAWMVVRVSDRGPGVSAAESGRIFEPFYRPRGEPADGGHAGLGLSIASQLAELQGGTVDYAARDGGGSVFTLRLPAADWSTESMPDE